MVTECSACRASAQVGDGDCVMGWFSDNDVVSLMFRVPWMARMFTDAVSRIGSSGRWLPDSQVLATRYYCRRIKWQAGQEQDRENKSIAEGVRGMLCWGCIGEASISESRCSTQAGRFGNCRMRAAKETINLYKSPDDAML